MLIGVKVFGDTYGRNRQKTSDSAFFMHVGHAIHEELKRQQRTAAWFARQLCCDRTNVYHIFRNKHINTDQLSRISKILNHNFFHDLANNWDKDSEE